jgi:hypothetical protein
MQKPREMCGGGRYNLAARIGFGPDQGQDMKLAASISFAVAMAAASSAHAADEQCRFIEARQQREACYQRQEVARAARQKMRAAHEAEQLKPIEPMSADDEQMARAMRGICRGC